MLNLYKDTKASGVVLLGRFYTYKYFARDKEPVFDMYPIVLVTLVRPQWFEGINLHYIEPRFRKEYWDQLKEFITIRDGGKYFNGIQYRQVYRTAKYRFGRPCIKRYRYENIFGRILRIGDATWDESALADREIFITKSISGTFKRLKSPLIWRESLRKTREAS